MNPTTIVSISNDDDFENSFFEPRSNTRKQRKQSRAKKRANRGALQTGTANDNVPNISLQMKTVAPITENQVKTWNAWRNGFHLISIGVAGSGKTYVALALALKDVLGKESGKKRVVIIRTAVSSRNQGFLPGDEKKKMAVFESPYISTCAKLFGRADAYEVLKKRGVIQFESTSYLRGETLEDAIVIFDEFQSAGFPELQTVITRVGENSRIIFSGDTGQNDLNFSRYDESGYDRFMKILRAIKEFQVVEYGINDICRSGLVKSYYIALANTDALPTRTALVSA